MLQTVTGIFEVIHVFKLLSRLIISDSVHYQQAMLATQLNDLVKNNTIANRCVIKLNEYLCNTVHGRK